MNKNIVYIIVLAALLLVILLLKKFKPNIAEINIKPVKKPLKPMIQQTWDLASQKNIDSLHPQIKQSVVNFINEAEKNGYKLRVTSGLRTYDEQKKLYAQGRIDKTKPKVTNAKEGESFHNFGLAIDVVPIVNGKADWNSKEWNYIAAIGKRFGFSWGGDWNGFKDKPHFEMNFKNTLANLRKKYEDGDNVNGYVNLA